MLELARRTAGPGFAPRTILDHGCGVGRLVVAFATAADRVVGVDVSPSMLAEARRNCESRGLGNVELTTADRLGALAPGFDLVHSFIVLQHIPPDAGGSIVETLASLVRPGGVGVIHVPIAARDRRTRLHTWVTQKVPFVSNLANLARRRPWSYPQMQMNVYDVGVLALRLAHVGYERITLELHPDVDETAYASCTIVFARPRRRRLAPDGLLRVARAAGLLARRHAALRGRRRSCSTSAAARRGSPGTSPTTRGSTARPRRSRRRRPRAARCCSQTSTSRSRSTTACSAAPCSRTCSSTCATRSRSCARSGASSRRGDSCSRPRRTPSAGPGTTTRTGGRSRARRSGCCSPTRAGRWSGSATSRSRPARRSSPRARRQPPPVPAHGARLAAVLAPQRLAAGAPMSARAAAARRGGPRPPGELVAPAAVAPPPGRVRGRRRADAFELVRHRADRRPDRRGPDRARPAAARARRRLPRRACPATATCAPPRRWRAPTSCTRRTSASGTRCRRRD